MRRLLVVPLVALAACSADEGSEPPAATGAPATVETDEGGTVAASAFEARTPEEREKVRRFVSLRRKRDQGGVLSREETKELRELERELLNQLGDFWTPEELRRTGHARERLRDLGYGPDEPREGR